MMFNILSAYQVDTNLFAGQKPYSLFDEDEIIDELKSKNIKKIISLMETNEINYNLTNFEKNFELLSFPIIDNTVPSYDVIQNILNNISNDVTTYVHCNLGLGRTGIIVGVYLAQRYGLCGDSILKKIDELKINSKLQNNKSPITKEQIDFILNLK